MKVDIDTSSCVRDFEKTVQHSQVLFNDLLQAIQLHNQNSGNIDGATSPYSEELVADLEKLVITNNDFLLQYLELLDEARVLQRENGQLKNDLTDLQNRYDILVDCQKKLDRRDATLTELRASKSFRIGRALVEAVKKPGIATLMMPVNIIKIAISK